MTLFYSEKICGFSGVSSSGPGGGYRRWFRGVVELGSDVTWPMSLLVIEMTKLGSAMPNVTFSHRNGRIGCRHGQCDFCSRNSWIGFGHGSVTFGHQNRQIWFGHGQCFWIHTWLKINYFAFRLLKGRRSLVYPAKKMTLFYSEKMMTPLIPKLKKCFSKNNLMTPPFFIQKKDDPFFRTKNRWAPLFYSRKSMPPISAGGCT